MKKFIMFILLLVMFMATSAFCATVVAWDPSAGADGYNLKYRAVGDAEWLDAAELVGTEFVVGSLPLVPGTRYEFQVFATKGDSTSGGSDILRWTFEGEPQVINIVERVKSLTLTFGE